MYSLHNTPLHHRISQSDSSEQDYVVQTEAMLGHSKPNCANVHMNTGLV